MTRTIAIAVGCAAAYIILVIGLMWWCRHRRRKQKRLMKEEEEAEANKPATNGVVSHGEGVPLNEYRDATSAVNPSYTGAAAAAGGAANHTAARRASYDKMQFPRHDLQSIAVIGKENTLTVRINDCSYLQRLGNLTNSIKSILLQIYPK